VALARPGRRRRRGPPAGRRDCRGRRERSRWRPPPWVSDRPRRTVAHRSRRPRPARGGPGPVRVTCCGTVTSRQHERPGRPGCPGLDSGWSTGRRREPDAGVEWALVATQPEASISFKFHLLEGDWRSRSSDMRPLPPLTGTVTARASRPGCHG
jgi:hypothetical protein